LPTGWLVTQQPPEKPGTWQVTVFLAYASEDSDVAVAVQAAITKYAQSNESGKVAVKKWPVNSELSETILDNVQSAIRERDFGVFIYSPVDGKAGDGRTRDGKARDNVVFETGLFLGMKKRDRTIILLPRNYKVTPSDLGGILGLEYPYDEVKDEENHLSRVDMLDEVGAIIVDRIRNVMAQPPPPQEQPDTGQSRSGPREGQPPGTLELISLGLAAQAALGKLTPLSGELFPGRIVVHAARGVGRVMGFDPPAAEPRYVEVQFGSAIGRYRTTELFVAPIDL
jgi:predicted nucleotide-binding protein